MPAYFRQWGTGAPQTSIPGMSAPLLPVFVFCAPLGFFKCFLQVFSSSVCFHVYMSGSKRRTPMSKIKLQKHAHSVKKGIFPEPNVGWLLGGSLGNHSHCWIFGHGSETVKPWISSWTLFGSGMVSTGQTRINHEKIFCLEAPCILHSSHFHFRVLCLEMLNIPDSTDASDARAIQYKRLKSPKKGRDWLPDLRR